MLNLRVPEAITARNSTFNINNALYKINKLYDQLSTGKRIHELKEDPIAAVLSMRYRARIDSNKQFMNNIDRVTSYFDNTDSALDHGIEILRRAKNLAIQASNGTLTASDRNDIKKEIDQLIEQLYQVGNATFEGKYIFAGSNTESPAFIRKENINEDKYAQYQGNDDYIYRTITETEKVAVNLPGSKIFFLPLTRDTKLSDLFNEEGITATPPGAEFEIIDKEGTSHTVNIDSLLNLPDSTAGDLIDTINNIAPTKFKVEINENKTGLVFKDLTGSNNSDFVIQDKGAYSIATQLKITGRTQNDEIVGESIQPADSAFAVLYKFSKALSTNSPSEIYERIMDKLDTFLKQFGNARAHIGSISSRLALTMKRLDKIDTNLNTLVSKQEDIDVVDAINKLKNEQKSYQLALQIGAQMLQLSLSDFLR